jgi:hypothetical protein
MKSSVELQFECYVCNRWQNSQTSEWYVPTKKQRKLYGDSGGDLSHGVCVPCYGKELRKTGHFSEGEIEKILKNAEAEVDKE